VHVFIDIETIPATMTEAEARALVQVPGNYKKAASIQRYIDENWPEVVARTSLNPHRGSVFCAVVATLEGEPAVFRLDECAGEADLLRQLGAHLGDLRHSCVEDTPTLVGWNCDGFDWPYLWRRSVMHRASLLVEIVPHGLRGRDGWRSLDLMAYWAGSNGYGSGRYVALLEVCNFLGIDCPPNGSSVAEHYRAGDLDWIVEHCKADVRALQQVWDRVQFAGIPF